ncbi:Arm DNA-binding domain-containing protein, partial [Salmonella enterica subsp. enterica serovar Kentucky]|nr:Arm DNA-binding domain-containing protein [Salmonella enterica subsp. enterica serovar Kentucky]
RVAGKEKLLALGVYPEVTLADARAKREDAKRGIAGGIDPMEAISVDKTAETDEEREARYAAWQQDWRQYLDDSEKLLKNVVGDWI